MHPGYVLPVEQFRLGRWIVLQIVCLSEVIYCSPSSMLVPGVELSAFPPRHVAVTKAFSPCYRRPCLFHSFPTGFPFLPLSLSLSFCLFLFLSFFLSFFFLSLFLFSIRLPFDFLIFVLLHLSPASLADNKIATDRDGKYLPLEKIVQNSSQRTQASKPESKERGGKASETKQEASGGFEREGQREFPLLSSNTWKSTYRQT